MLGIERKNRIILIRDLLISDKNQTILRTTEVERYKISPTNKTTTFR